jgi:hypothetical protein
MYLLRSVDGAVGAANQTADTEREDSDAGEQGDAGRQHWPAALQPLACGTQNSLRPVRSEDEHRDDRDQRQHEADVEQPQKYLAGGGKAGVDDCRDRSEVWKRGRSSTMVSVAPRMALDRIRVLAVDQRCSESRRRRSQRSAAALSMPEPIAISMMWRACGEGCGIAASASCPGPSTIARPPARYTTNTAKVNAST